MPTHAMKLHEWGTRLCGGAPEFVGSNPTSDVKLSDMGHPVVELVYFFVAFVSGRAKT